MREPRNEMMGALLDIYYELRNTEIRPIVVGGLAIYLRARDVFEREAATLIPLAPARATQDIDMLLAPETILQASLRGSFKQMLNILGFQVIRSRAYWQYKRYYYHHEQKLDLQTWTPTASASSSYRIIEEKLESMEPGAHLDAHIANEAIGIENFATTVDCSDFRTDGTAYQCSICIAHPFTLAVMKLLAYRDYAHRAADTEMSTDNTQMNLRFAQKHALDIMVLFSTVTEGEWYQAKQLARDFGETAVFQDAKSVVREAFSEIDANGMIHMRTSLDATPDMPFSAAPSLLIELFGVE